METEQQIYERIEKNNKEIIKQKIINYVGDQTTLVNCLQKNARIFKIKHKVPTMATTFNNKTNQISQTFMQAGISMYATIDKQTNLAQSSILGEVIIADLYDYIQRGQEKLKQIEQILEQTSVQNSDKMQAIICANKIQIYFMVIKARITHENLTAIEMPQEQRTKIKTIYQEYSKIDEELWEYELSEHIVQAIPQYIRKMQYRLLDIPNILRIINQDLTTLGFERLMPQIENAVNEEFKKEMQTNRKLSPLIESLKVNLEVNQQNIEVVKKILDEVSEGIESEKEDNQK